MFRIRILAQVIFLVTICLFYSCKKEKLNVNYVQLNTGSSQDLEDIYFVDNDIAYICGGLRDYGVVLKSIDGGLTWNTIYSGLPSKLFAIHFYDQNHGIAVGENYKQYFTLDGGSNWTEYWFGNFPSTEFQVTLRSIHFINDSTGFICGGDNFDKGILLKTTNKGADWTFLTYDHELRDISFTENRYGLCGGYGIMLQSTNNGNNWVIADAPAEFYTGVDAQSNKVIVSGYNGNILWKQENSNSWNEGIRSRNLSGKHYFFNSVSWVNEYIVYAAGDGGVLAQSSDGGSSWKTERDWADENLNNTVKGPDQNLYVLGDDGMLIRIIP